MCALRLKVVRRVECGDPEGVCQETLPSTLSHMASSIPLSVLLNIPRMAVHSGGGGAPSRPGEPREGLCTHHLSPSTAHNAPVFPVFTSVTGMHQCPQYAPVFPVCTSVPSVHQCSQCAPVSSVFTSVPSVHLDNRYLPVRHPQCGGYPLIMFSHACQKREGMPRVYFKTLRSRPGRHLWRRLCPQRYGRREAPQRFMLFSLSGYFERRE